MSEKSIRPVGPPIAPPIPVESVHHGDRRVDPYDWLRDRGYPKVTDARVLAHLGAENEYLESVLAPHAALRRRLFEELKARLEPDEASVPFPRGPYLYQQRYRVGDQYPHHVRWRAAGASSEELLLDLPALARGRAYLDVRAVVPSDDHRLLAYSVDVDGSERYVLRILDLGDGTELGEGIADTFGTVVWALDSATIFYARLDESLRPSRIYRHRLGTPPSSDALVYEERDPAFWTSIESTLDGRFVLVRTRTKDTAEVWMLDAARPGGDFRVVAPRRAGHDYDVEHRDGTLYVRTNDRSRSFRVATAPASDPGEERWQDWIPPCDAIYRTELLAFEGHLVVLEREHGLPQVRIVDAASGAQHRVAFPDPAYSVQPLDNFEHRSRVLRLAYQSLVTPRTVFDYDMDARTLVERKVQRIPSGYERADYASERLSATAADGERIPVSIVYRKDRPRPGPLYLYAYGAYGLTLDPYFSTHRLSLLDRGFAFAIAHVRGGSEMGRPWYDAGKLFEKKNSFGDLVTVAEELVARGHTRKGEVTVSGGSAGGLCVGAVVNARADLFHAAVAHVPFVDCLNTMLDASLPLTPPEYSEWGNPEEDARAYAYIRSYSPYDNVRPQAYPHMLVTAGLSDPRVTYWEPAKWVARLRAEKTDDRLLLLKTNMAAGHRGASGRYEALEDLALEYTFLLHVYDRVSP
jgi:oligopeptidase B